MAGDQGSNIQITGVKQTIAALEAFDPEMKKALDKTIKSALAVVRAGAQAKFPDGAWTIGVTKKKLLGYVAARSGGGGWGPPWKKVSDLAPGTKAAVFEFIGSRSRGATPQARRLIESITARYGQPGRFLWSSWDEHGQQALEDIKYEVLKAERDLQRMLDAAGEGF